MASVLLSSVTCSNQDSGQSFVYWVNHSFHLSVFVCSTSLYRKLQPYQADPNTLHSIVQARRQHYVILWKQFWNFKKVKFSVLQIYQKLYTNALDTRSWPLLYAPPASPTHADAPEFLTMLCSCLKVPAMPLRNTGSIYLYCKRGPLDFVNFYLLINHV